MELERRSAPLEVRGRRIAGLAVPWGQRASIPEHGEEVFTAGAFGDDLKPVALTLEHGGPKIGEVQPANSERGLEVEGSYSGDLQGRDRFSIEFRAKARIPARKGSGSCTPRNWSRSHPSGDPPTRVRRSRRARVPACSC